MQDVELPRQARWDDAVGTGDHVEAGARAQGYASSSEPVTARRMRAASAGRGVIRVPIFAFPGAGSTIRLMNRPSG